MQAQHEYQSGNFYGAIHGCQRILSHCRQQQASPQSLSQCHWQSLRVMLECEYVIVLSYFALCDDVSAWDSLATFYHRWHHRYHRRHRLNQCQHFVTSTSGTHRWTGRPLKQRHNNTKSNNDDSKRTTFCFHCHYQSTTNDTEDSEELLLSSSEEDWRWIALYLHGYVLFMLLLAYLQQPQPPSQHSPITDATRSSSLYPYLHALVYSWPASIEAQMRSSFFVLHSYARMLMRLRLPMYTPSIDQLKQWHRRACRPTASYSDCTPIFVLGESHSLSIVWQFLNIGGHCYQLQPAFVMGLKAFHFAPSNAHYVSHTLRARIQSLPYHSLVMVQCGEIDCRLIGGLTLAVRKGKYQSLAEAVASTARQFVDGIIGMCVARRCHVLVCPVRPPPLKKRKVKKSYRWEEIKKQRGYTKEDASVTSHSGVANASCEHKGESDIESENEAETKDAVADASSSMMVSGDGLRSYDTRDLKCVQSVYRHAILIRDFNAAIQREVELVQHRDLRRVCEERTIPLDGDSSDSDDDTFCPSTHWLGMYSALCDNPNNDDFDQPEPAFGAGNGADYLLNGRYSLEGLHLNSLYCEVLESTLESLYQQQSDRNGASVFEEVNRLHRFPLVPCPSLTQQHQHRPKPNEPKSHAQLKDDTLDSVAGMFDTADD